MLGGTQQESGKSIDCVLFKLNISDFCAIMAQKLGIQLLCRINTFM
jgi:hypothetical protein